ncbi:MAG: hypothetical protein GOVbin4206_129 [Prokaryotic dsDNA virus sp.]|nr:MAG: hypothetical protein GOVbin4206_129 [Prokaryotic dsDNA virus sp.]|tara:strand:+ start:387 stop:650 length:264 start_codon:yes stop_codon:yes gene_type:complete
MSELIDERYVLKSGSYLADLSNVDFITWRQSDEGIMLKLHIDQKEIRFVCNKKLAEEILGIWTKFRGHEINMNEYEIGGINGYNWEK